MKHLALIGNPNCGKTTLFNALTGSTAHVGNWPGVTVDKKEGTYKKLKDPISIIDLPGIYSLSPYTSEELITRNYLLKGKVDCIINIVDATNLIRNLYLTTQIMELDIPIVIALNMMDELKNNGESIDVDMLSLKLGVPVIPICALKGENIDELMQKCALQACLKREGTTILKECEAYKLISNTQSTIAIEDGKHSLFHAIKLVENDEMEIKSYPQLADDLNNSKKNYNLKDFDDDFEALIANYRYQYINEHYAESLKKAKNKEKLTKSDKIDKVLTNKWAGIPIFLFILFLIFHLTFSENFLFCGWLFKIFEIGPSFEGSFFEGLLWSDAGINSPGVILFNFLECLSNGLSDVVATWLSSSPEWVSGLIVEGVLGGLLAVLSFLPQILCLFLFFSILEDSGYMARVAFILDRIFRKFGLSGRAFMPMIMGFGCSVPAMINTRTLADENEKTATIRVIPFFSCGAKLPILTAIAGGIVQVFDKGNADIITYSMYLLGMAVAIISVLVMKQTTMKGEVPPFIMELPAYHMPQFKALMIHLWDKVKHFIKKAFTIILASTIIIWFISHFSYKFEFLANEEIDRSILASIGKFIQPIFTPLGFGSQLPTFGWVFVVAAITGLIAKENVIATFGALAACIVGAAIDVEADGGDVLAASTMILGTGITIPALISFIAFNMTTIPCFAAVATAKGELSSKKKFIFTILFWIITSYIVSSAIYVIGTWWWSLFIYLGVIVLIVATLSIYNKKKLKCGKNVN